MYQLVPHLNHTMERGFLLFRTPIGSSTV